MLLHWNDVIRDSLYRRSNSPAGTVKYFKTRRVTRIHSKSMDQPGMVANPARGQLNRKK